MNSDRVSNWLTLGANIGVIVGIAFLVMEMRQNSDIATAQARLDYAAGWRAVDASRQDAAFAAVLAKSIETPEDLSPVEVIQLDAYYWGVIDQMLSAKTASETGLREDSYEHAANAVARLYFSNAFAQSWWKQARSTLAGPAEQAFVQVMDNAINSRKQDRSVAPFQLLYQDLNASGDAALIRSLREQSNAAIAQHDAEGIGSFLSDDFVITISTGEIERSRDEHITSFSQHFADFPDVLYVRSPSQITVSDAFPLALEQGTWVGTRTSENGKQRKGGAYTAAWKKTDQGWRIYSELYLAHFCEGAGC